MSQVRCVVEECVYNNQHGFCQAGSIRVRPSSGNHVQSSDNTSCATFIPGGAGNIELTTASNFEDGSITAGGEHMGDYYVDFVEDANSIWSH